MPTDNSYINRWQAEHTQAVQFKLREDNDADILSWLEKKDSMQAYVIGLIAADEDRYIYHMVRHKETPPKNRIKILKINKEKHKDVLRKLEDVKDKSKYIRDLIRRDMKSHGAF